MRTTVLLSLLVLLYVKAVLPLTPSTVCPSLSLLPTSSPTPVLCQQEQSGPGFLPFLCLRITSGVETLLVIRSDDGVTGPINITGGMPFGESRQTSVYISTNGYLSFGRPVNDFTPTLFPEEHTFLVAPYWSDINILRGGLRVEIPYEVHTSGSLLSQVNAFISEEQNVSFSGQWMLVVEWREVPPFGFGVVTERNTFQAIIVTDGSARSYAVFTYRCGSMQWSGEPATIGFNADGGLFENHPLSETLNSRDIACQRFPETVWNNVVYQLAAVVIPSATVASSAAIATPFLTPSPSPLPTQVPPTPVASLTAITTATQGLPSLNEFPSPMPSTVRPSLSVQPTSSPTPVLCQQEQSGPGYLPFLCLRITSGVETLLVIRSDDGVTGPINITGGMPFGESRQTSVYISTNGYLSFGRPVSDFTPTLFPEEHTFLVAPYWSDINILRGGQRAEIPYEVHTSGPLLSQVNAFISEEQNVSFSGQWMLVVEWREVPPFGFGVVTERNTFQAIIITDGSERSYAVFTYRCGSMQWSGDPATIGFNADGGLFENHPLSETLNSRDIACQRFPETVWNNVLYQLAALSAAITTPLLTPSPSPTPTEASSPAITTPLLTPSPSPLPTEGSCVNAGFTTCCDPVIEDCGQNGCFCDQSCYEFGDCCFDIQAINCFSAILIPSATVASSAAITTPLLTPSPPTEGSCVNAGFTTCCDPVNEICGVNGCFCDQLCYEAGDCCFDIQAINCFPALPSLTAFPSLTPSTVRPSLSVLPTTSPTPVLCQQEQSGPGYLPFLCLRITSGVETLLVIRSDDGVTGPIDITGGMPFGESRQTSVYISTNGYLSFGRPVNDFTPTLFPEEHTFLVAPYWSDINILRGGQRAEIPYEVHTSGSLLSQVNAFISEEQDVSFSGQWMLVVEWREVPPFGFGVVTERNTFQAIIITDGSERSYAVFTYRCGSMQWSGDPATIGFNADGGLFENHPLSETLNSRDIACQRFPETVWNNVVYQLAGKQTDLHHAAVITSKEEEKLTTTAVAIPSATVASSAAITTPLLTPSPSPLPTEAITTPLLTPSPSLPPEGSCVNAGFTMCCDPAIEICGLNGCFCDQFCYVAGDCCFDIQAINCFPAVVIPSATVASSAAITTPFLTPSPSPLPTEVSVIPSATVASPAAITTPFLTPSPSPPPPEGFCTTETDRVTVRVECPGSETIPGIDGFLCSLDGGNFFACVPPFSISALSEGPHTIEVVARRTDGNGTVAVGRSQFVIDGLDLCFINDTPQVDGTGILRAQFQTNRPDSSVVLTCRLIGRIGREVDDIRFNSTQDCGSGSVTYNNLPLGDYVFRVIARDTANGNRAVIRSGLWILGDNDFCTITAINRRVTVFGNSATIEFGNTGAPTGFVCRLDDQSYSPCSSPVTVTNLSPGAHRLTIRPAGCGRAGIGHRRISIHFEI